MDPNETTVIGSAEGSADVDQLTDELLATDQWTDELEQRGSDDQESGFGWPAF